MFSCNRQGWSKDLKRRLKRWKRNCNSLIDRSELWGNLRWPLTFKNGVCFKITYKPPAGLWLQSVSGLLTESDPTFASERWSFWRGCFLWLLWAPERTTATPAFAVVSRFLSIRLNPLHLSGFGWDADRFPLWCFRSWGESPIGCVHLNICRKGCWELQNVCRRHAGAAPAGRTPGKLVRTSDPSSVPQCWCERPNSSSWRWIHSSSLMQLRLRAQGPHPLRIDWCEAGLRDEDASSSFIHGWFNVGLAPLSRPLVSSPREERQEKWSADKREPSPRRRSNAETSVGTGQMFGLKQAASQMPLNGWLSREKPVGFYAETQSSNPDLWVWWWNQHNQNKIREHLDPLNLSSPCLRKNIAAAMTTIPLHESGTFQFCSFRFIWRWCYFPFPCSLLPWRRWFHSDFWADAADGSLRVLLPVGSNVLHVIKPPSQMKIRRKWSGKKHDFTCIFTSVCGLLMKPVPHRNHSWSPPSRESLLCVFSSFSLTVIWHHEIKHY